MESEGHERATIGRHCMVHKEAGDNLPQPFPLFGDCLMHAPAQLVPDLAELGSHAVASGFPFDQEVASARFAADEDEAQEVERFRFSEPESLASRA